jgi:mycofactocin system glycosyltransferase
LIPLTYRLRPEIRFEHRNGSVLVVSEVPLNVVRVSCRAEVVLRSCDGRRSVHRIAAEVPDLSEEQVFRICEYFNRKGVLETVQTRNDGYFPSVTVIIPARDRRDELVECLESVFFQDYPGDRIEVIVIDDGSRDSTASSAAAFPCKLLFLGRSRGQSFCRNLGAREAGGEIIAFLDSDCVADKGWLAQIVPYFQWERIGAVGGRVDGYFAQSRLDRYEKTFSSLNMGKHILYGGSDDSLVYTPTCNLLVRRSVYRETGGIRDDMRLGEDVDFCWRMRAKGHVLLYVPFGAVRHKHRNRLFPMLRRRSEYGTSEASLYRLHPAKRKVFPAPPLGVAAFLGLCAAVAFISPIYLCLPLGCFVFDGAAKTARTRRRGLRIPLWKAYFSVVRTYFSFFYLVSFHVVRYYLALLVLLGFVFHPLWLLSLFLIALSSIVDYTTKRPRLAFPVFLFYYTLEHVFYQAGVFAGCVRAGTFGSYRPRVLARRLHEGRRAHEPRRLWYTVAGFLSTSVADYWTKGYPRKGSR